MPVICKRSQQLCACIPEPFRRYHAGYIREELPSWTCNGQLLHGQCPSTALSGRSPGAVSHPAQGIGGPAGPVPGERTGSGPTASYRPLGRQASAQTPSPVGKARVKCAAWGKWAAPRGCKQACMCRTASCGRPITMQWIAGNPGARTCPGHGYSGKLASPQTS